MSAPDLLALWPRDCCFGTHRRSLYSGRGGCVGPAELQARPLDPGNLDSLLAHACAGNADAARLLLARLAEIGVAPQTAVPEDWRPVLTAVAQIAAGSRS